MQMPMDEKVQRADVVIWNDGSLDALEAEDYRCCIMRSVKIE